MVRRMQKRDYQAVLDMMRVFYDSPAILFEVADDVLKRDIDACVSSNPFVHGYIIESNGEIAGYAMAAMGFSTEFGGLCVWTEDLYIKPEFRGLRLADEYFAELKRLYPDAVRFRLEVEANNEIARHVYKRNGYQDVPYIEMDLC